MRTLAIGSGSTLAERQFPDEAALHIRSQPGLARFEVLTNPVPANFARAKSMPHRPCRSWARRALPRRRFRWSPTQPLAIWASQARAEHTKAVPAECRWRRNALRADQ